MRFWSVAMMAACCKEIKAGSVKWLKSAGAAWVFTFFFLSIPERMSGEGKRGSSADRAPVHATSFIFDNIHGGIGLLWIWSEIFQRAVGVELGLGFLAVFGLCFREMKHTWFPAFPLIRQGFVADATGTHWLIRSLFNDRLIAADNILQVHLYLAKPSKTDLLFMDGLFFVNLFFYQISLSYSFTWLVFRCNEEQFVLIWFLISWSQCERKHPYELP